MERVVTNLVKLNELKRRPCVEWLKYFNENGIADVHEAFVKENNYDYWSLYHYSNIDLIAWEIENNCFDWERFSWAVASYCPNKIDPDKFDWKRQSWAIAKYCPNKIDPHRFNWEEDSWAVALYCSDKLDPHRYSLDYGWAVKEYCLHSFCLYYFK